jgi:hypothetical protein
LRFDFSRVCSTDIEAVRDWGEVRGEAGDPGVSEGTETDAIDLLFRFLLEDARLNLKNKKFLKFKSRYNHVD